MTHTDRESPIGEFGGDGVWAADVVLNDGGTVHVRPIRSADVATLQQFHARQPRESQYYRYFTPKPALSDKEATRFSTVDLRDRGALVVEDGEEFIAWASYERWSGRDDADVAFHVDQGHGNRGIATLLLEHLSSMARAAGIRRFTAEVLADNRPMLKVFRRTGWPIDRHFDSGIVDFAWPIDDTADFLANVARREQLADSRSMARFLLPRSIAVIGASDEPGSVGRTLLANSLASLPGVPVYPVNPHCSTLLDQPCYASIDDVPDDVGLAVVAVPESALAEVLTACARRRVRGAVVVTDVSVDFPLADVVTDARRYGMRIVGPGSMGVAMPGSSPAIHAHLGTRAIPAGPLAISLQSGSLGASVLDRITRLGVGVSSFVSLGDKADVSGNDLLQFWEDDDSTGVIAMYTESFGNPRRFARIARRVSRARPIVAVRPGGTAIDDALYQQAGVIRVDTVAEMLDTVRVLAVQPLVSGPRIAVITNSAGPARLLVAGLESVGLEPTGFDGRPGWHQLLWSAGAGEYVDAIEACRVGGTHDAVVVIHAPPVAPTDDVFARQLAAHPASEPHLPTVAVLLGRDDGLICPGSTIPNFAFPDDVAHVLGRIHTYARWRTAVTTEVVPSMAAEEPGARPEPRVRELIDAALERRPDGTLLPLGPMIELLRAWGIPVASSRAVTNRDDAVAAADELGYPVVLKANTRPRPGRGLDAGVALDLSDAAGIDIAWNQLDNVVGGLVEATVQSMVPSGIECRIHATVHPALGPVISVGLGGVFADSLDDQIVRLGPVSVAGAVEMLAESRVGRVIAELGSTFDAPADVIVAVSTAMDHHPELFEIDLNSVIVAAEGCWVVDAAVRVRPSTTGGPLRRLG